MSLLNRERIESFLDDTMKAFVLETGYPNDIKMETGKMSLIYELPGSSKEDVDIEYEGYDLKIIVKGGRQRGVKRITINKEYNISATTATMKDGVLTVVIPTGKKDIFNVRVT